MGKKDKKVCIIGLDGLGYNNILNVLNGLTLNNLRKFLDKGFLATFRSIPPYTPFAWTSLFTGVNPGKHGILGFLKMMRKGDTIKALKAMANDVMYPRIFEITSSYGLKNIVINVPFTYPPQDIFKAKDMIIVSDWASPKQIIYPSHYENKYREYLCEPPFNWNPHHVPSDAQYIKLVEEYLNKRLNMYLDLLEKQNFHLYIIVFSELDWIMHRIPEVVEGKGLNRVYNIYSLIDKFIGKSMMICDLVVITSDHGFAIANTILRINSILAHEGLLSYYYKFDLDKIFKRKAKRRYLWRKRLDNCKTSNLIENIVKNVVNLIPKNLAKKLERFEHIIPLLGVIKYAESKAFMYEEGTWGLYVKEKYRAKVKNILLNNVFIKDVIDREKLFRGPYVRDLPELIVIPKEGVIFDTGLKTSFYSKVHIGHHHPTAIMGFYSNILGETMKKEIPEVSIYDLVPTILYFFDLPIPYDTDGKPLMIFEKSMDNIRYGKRHKLIQAIKNVSKKLPR